MSRAKEDPGATQAQRPRHAGVGVRIAANLIDLIIMGVPVLLLVSTIIGAEARTGKEAVTLADFYNLESFLNAVLVAAITVLLWVNWDGRTPGKKLTRIRIVSYPDYKPFSYGIATLRMVLSLTGAITFFVGYLAMAVMIASRRDRRGYHDLIAKTCVIHDN